MAPMPTDTTMARAMQTDTHVQVEAGDASLRQELEAARQALRLQTTRCRQVDAALSRRLEQKELEIKNWKTLREQQLGHVMHALMILEGRLRREQRNIRSMLGERDAVIRMQQLEIARLRKSLDSEVRQEEMRASPLNYLSSSPTCFEYDCDVKPDLISSLGISHSKKSPDKSVTPTTMDNEDSQSNLDSLHLSFYEIGSQPESLMSNSSTHSCMGDTYESTDPSKDFYGYQTVLSAPHQSNSGHQIISNKLESADIKSPRMQSCTNNTNQLEVNVHIESQFLPQKNILSPVKEESSLSLLSGCSSSAKPNICEDKSIRDVSASCDTSYKDCKPSPSTLLQEVRISGRNEYEDNPVLSCVNQILLRDQEEFLEEQRTLRLKEQEKSKKEAEAKLNDKKLTKSTENLSLLNEQIIVQHSPVKTKAYPPLNSVIPHHVVDQNIQHSPPEDNYKTKAYPPLNSVMPHHVVEQNIKHIPPEDNYKTISNIPSHKKRTVPKENLQIKGTPPALPPKPQGLLISKSLNQKTIISSIIPQLKVEDTNTIDMVKKRISLQNPSSDNELYVISNSAIDDDLLHQLQGRQIKSCSELPVCLKKSRPLTQSRESIYVPVLFHSSHSPPAKSSNTNNVHISKDKSTDQKTVSKKSPLKEEDITKTKKHSPNKIASQPNTCIKVASPVSSLLNSFGTIEPSLEENSEKTTSPSVSQMVRKFEDLGTKSGKDSDLERIEDNNNSLQTNFEEFHLDECDMEALCSDGRPEGDGAENRLNTSTTVMETRISYENFLEATGLSQKSIMTPSRLFSNHKSVMKPKDVKHRSRVKAAAGGDRCNTSMPSGSVVRYWTEPFL